jgi:hypothetical protein
VKRGLQALAVGLACCAIVLGGSAFLFPIRAAGRVFPDGSGVYIGHRTLLSNQHVLVDSSEGQQVFSVPAWKYLDPILSVPVQKVVFLDRNLELGVARLQPSLLDFVRVAVPCLSIRPLKRGETLTVTSDPQWRFPPVSASVVVSDPRPLPRLDPDPVSAQSQYAAMTILTTLSADQAKLVGHGSSGGPVLNGRGELVGLVWTGRELADGSKEVWVTPVSAWLRELHAPEIPKEDLQVLLDARCPP